MSAKIFRDPLYNYISIDRDRDKWLLELLNAPEIQRLRRIHQLGVSCFTYPGADHSRLAHSLGVLHLMQQLRLRHQTISTDAQVSRANEPLLAAALVHDVGHGPFSHLFEPCLAIDHEDWSKAIILAPESRVHDRLRHLDRSLPKMVADLIDKKNHDHPSWMKFLVRANSMLIGSITCAGTACLPVLAMVTLIFFACSTRSSCTPSPMAAAASSGLKKVSLCEPTTHRLLQKVIYPPPHRERRC